MKSKRFLYALLPFVFALILPVFVSTPARAANVAINSTNFPDSNFRSYVSSTYDTNGDNVLSPSEIAAAKEMEIENKNISNLKGIEYFTALETLLCHNNKLTGLDLTSNTELKYLSCFSNQLTSLNVSQNTNLIELLCQENNLTSLTLTANTALEFLVCYGNQLTSLDTSGIRSLLCLACNDNPELTTLRCYSCDLEILDVFNCPKLTLLNCHDNRLSELDLSGDTVLTDLYCQKNLLEELDLTANTALKYLDCDHNQLTELDVTKNTQLRNLWCNNNQLTELDVTNNTALTLLNCHTNQLTSLDVSRNTALTLLQCSSNELTDLDVGSCTALTDLCCEKNDLTDLDVSRNTSLKILYCYDNNIASLDISKCPNLVAAYTTGTRLEKTDTATGTPYLHYWQGNYYLLVDPQTAVRVAETVQINGMTLELEGKLGIHFFFTPPESAATAKLVFHGQKTTTLNFELIRDKAHGYNAGTGRFKLSYKNIAMKEMTCPVTLTVYYANGAPMTLIRSGSPVEGNALDFCVADWCNLTISGSGSQKSIDLAKALLRFGGTAQEYFNFNLNSHANPNDYLAAEAAAVTADTSLNRVVPTGAQEATGYQNFSLNLEGNTEIRINFSKKVTAKDGNGKAYTVVKVSDNKYYVSIPDIAAVDLDKMFIVKVPASGKTYTFKFAALSWANAVINSSNAAQKNLARALYLYNRYAEEYFN